MINLLPITMVIAQVVSGQAPARAFSVATRLPYSIEAELDRLANAKLPVQRTKHTAPLTRDAAIASVRSTLQTMGKANDRRALELLSSKAQAAKLHELGIGLLVTNRRAGSLAVLLEAHQKAPRDPLITVSLASVMAGSGFGAEAVALLADSPNTASPSVMAMHLTARGYALITTGKNAQAEPLLRRAMQLDPTIAESARCLAYVLVQRGARTEAVKVIRDAGRAGGIQSRSAAGRPYRRPLGEAYDLSKGHAITLKEVPRVSASEATLEPIAKLEENTKALEEWTRQLEPTRGPLEADIERRRASGEINALTARIASEILERLEWEMNHTAYGDSPNSAFPSDSTGMRLAKAIQVAFDAFHEANGQAQEEFVEKMPEAAQQMAQTQSCQPMARLHQRVTARINPLADAYEKALADWWAFASPRATGLVANLKDPTYHALAKFMVDAELVNLEAALWSVRAFTYAGPGYAAQCAKQEKEKAEAKAFESRVNTAPCALGTGKLKITFLFLEAKADCEEISFKVLFNRKAVQDILGVDQPDEFLEVDMGLFAEATIGNAGEWSVYAGLEGGISGLDDRVGANAQVGMFISGNSDGLDDIGVRFAAELGATAGVYEGSEPFTFDAGVNKSLEGWAALLSP